MAPDDPIRRLARQIDASRKSERFRVNAEEVAWLRLQGACQLYQVCADFVSSLSRRMSDSLIELSPPSYEREMFRERGVNLIQISSHGRQMQIVFQATSTLFSTDKYTVPYILEGEIRTYNQSMLDRFEIRNQSLFYCVDEDKAFWRFYDWRNPRILPVDADLLASLLQRLF